MNREQVIKYLKSSGFVDTQIKVIERAFTDSDCISRELTLEKMSDYVASGYADRAEDFEQMLAAQFPSDEYLPH